MNQETDTPRTDACPHCGAEQQPISNRAGGMPHDGWICGTRRFLPENIRTDLCREREARQKAEAEVERLRGNLHTELLVLKIRSLIADKEMVTAQANLDLARGGEWRTDYAAWHVQFEVEIQSLLDIADAKNTLNHTDK